MNNVKRLIVDHPKTVIIIFLVLTLVCGLLIPSIKINQDNASYLPDSSNSKQAVEKLSEEFGINGNVTLMVKDVSLKEAARIKSQILEVEGVSKVVWLDDFADISTPVEFIDKTYINQFYKSNNPLMQIMLTTGNDDKVTHNVIDEIAEIAGEKGYISGPAAVSKSMIERTNREIPIYVAVALVLILIILFSTTSSWLEPLVFLASIGAAIVINMGTNIIWGEISQITFAAAAVLQLAVSLDYSIFLLHRFHEERAKGLSVRDSMLNSIRLSYSSILASGLTTFAGFIALVFMQYRIGPDLGLVLAKGIILSMISVFTLLPALIIVLSKWIEKYTHRELKLGFKRISRGAVKVRYLTMIIAVVLGLVFFLAQSNVNYYYTVKKMIPDEDTTMIAAQEQESIYGHMSTNSVLVPKGDRQTETELINELKKLPNVASVSGLYTSLPAGIPEMLLPEEVKAMFLSENYSMITVSMKSGDESSEAFAAVDEMREITDKYYDDWYIAGETFSYNDLKDITDKDFLMVNILSIILIFLIVAVTFKSLSIPLIAVLVIEMGIWINLGISYFTDAPTSFLASIIIGAVQLGATVDYAILFINSYKENLAELSPIQAAAKTIRDTAKSILTSAAVLISATFSVYYIATIKTASELCLLIGRGAIISMIMVLFVLPGFLIVFNKFIGHTTIKWPGAMDRREISEKNPGEVKNQEKFEEEAI